MTNNNVNVQVAHATIAKVQTDPGDVVVVSVDAILGNQQCKRLTQGVKGFFPQNSVLVFDRSCRIHITQGENVGGVGRGSHCPQCGAECEVKSSGICSADKTPASCGWCGWKGKEVDLVGELATARQLEFLRNRLDLHESEEHHEELQDD